jgi:hypothetical protein
MVELVTIRPEIRIDTPIFPMLVGALVSITFPEKIGCRDFEGQGSLAPTFELYQKRFE